MRNLRASIYNAESLIVQWDDTMGSNVSGFITEWYTAGNHATPLGTKISQSGLVQPQLLVKGTAYDVCVTPIDAVGDRVDSSASWLLNQIPMGTYETGIETTAATNPGKVFYFDARNAANMPMMIPNAAFMPFKFPDAFYGCRAGIPASNPAVLAAPGVAQSSTDPSRFNNSGAAVNDQHHWHMFLSDLGTGEITCRFNAMMAINAGNTTGQASFFMLDDDMCVGFPGEDRQAIYVVLSPHRSDCLKLFPGNGDSTALFPTGPEFRFRIMGPTVCPAAFYLNGAVAGPQPTFNYRGNVGHNVRQIRIIRVVPTGIEFWCDQTYSGTPTLVYTYPVDTTSWGNSLYVYITFGSYNNPKVNDVCGVRVEPSSGIPYLIKQMALRVWHLGKVMIFPAVPDPLDTTGNSAAVLAGTPIPPMDMSEFAKLPPAQQILSTMPSDADLYTWGVPQVQITPYLPAGAYCWRGTVPVTLTANTGETAGVTTAYRRIVEVGLWIDPVFSPPFPGAIDTLDGVTVTGGTRVNQVSLVGSAGGVLQTTQVLNLDTSKLSDGYHTLLGYALTEDGTFGIAFDNQEYAFNMNTRILVQTEPPVVFKPEFIGIYAECLQISNGAPLFPDQNINPDAAVPTVVYIFSAGANQKLNFQVKTKALISVLTMTANGTYNAAASWVPMNMPSVKQPDGTYLTNVVWGCTDSQWTWYPGYGTTTRFVVTCIDADGNTNSFKFMWSWMT